MTVVIAGTSPLNYLGLIGHAEILHLLYTTVTVPTQVLNERSSAGAPPTVRDWLRSPPNPSAMSCC